ncbi:MAG: cyclic nucleotide-binding domain-containing protein [Myxococcales bacterium]|nr:cyclic nucleotide-binding domain-containing protein [Myxococcales bacterium]MCB9641478.1 cyclic nucleotide-binding domain-containing protein [Myxococcales bacterium]
MQPSNIESAPISLVDTMQAVAKDPSSLEDRTALAVALQEREHPQAQAAWEAVAFLAAAKGDFFHSLLILRLHLDDEQQRQVLQTIMRYFLADPSEQTSPWDPKLPARQLQIPNNPSAQVALALQLVRDLKGVKLTAAIPKPSLALFSDLPEKLLIHLLRKMEPIPLLEGDPLVQQGQNDQACYLLTHGRVRIFQRRNNGQDIPLARLRAPAVLGATSLLTTAPHRLSLTADEPSMAWRIDLGLFTSIAQRHQLLVHKLRSFVREHLQMLLLRFYPQLMSLTEPERQILLQTFLLQSIEPNGVLIQQDAPSPGLFIPAYGEALVFSSQGGSMQVFVAELPEGDICGARAFWQQMPSPYTILMPEGGFVFHLGPRELQILQQQAPTLYRKLTELRQLPY